MLKRYYKFIKFYSLNNKRLIKYILRDYNINLKPSINLKFFLIYKLIEMENLALKKIVKKNLRKGYIRPLQLLVKYLVLFILKKKQEIKNIY